MQNWKLLAFDLTVSRGPLTVYGQVIFSRFPGITPEVQSPNAFRVPFYPELVGRVTGWYHKVIVIFFDGWKQFQNPCVSFSVRHSHSDGLMNSVVSVMPMLMYFH